MSNLAQSYVGYHWCAHATESGGWVIYTDDEGDPILDALDVLTDERDWEVSALPEGGWLIEPARALVTIR